MNDESYEQMQPSPLEVEDNKNHNKKQKGFNLITMLTSIPKQHLINYIIIFALGCGIIISLVFLSFKANELSNLNQKNEELEKEIKELAGEEEKIKEEKFYLETQLKDLENDKRLIEGDIYRLNQQNREYEINYRRNEATLSELKKQNEQLDIDIETKKQENAELQKKVNEQGDIPIEVQEKANVLKGEIEKIKQEINEIKAEKMKGMGFDSKIITASQFESLLQMISQVNNIPKKFIKIYDISTDGFKAKAFHDKCDKYEGTITILQDIRDNIVGGFTTQSWGGQGYKQDSTAFLFNLSNNKSFYATNSRRAIQANPTCLAIFGDGDLSICEKESRSEFPRIYGAGSDSSDLVGSTAIIIPKLEVYAYEI